MIDNPTKDQIRDHALAILAHLNGEPVEYRYINEVAWIRLAPYHDAPWNSDKVFFRPTPAPKMRPWSKPEDVPIHCWLKYATSIGAWQAVTAADDIGMTLLLGDESHPTLHRATWETIAQHWLYSTDRVTWKKCEVTEP